jgi:hypothetical protein
MMINNTAYSLSDSIFVVETKNETVNLFGFIGTMTEITKITGPWFTITKNNDTTMTISVTQNNTDSIRSFMLPVQYLDYYTGISVNQTTQSVK